ncbi:uncharacterized protein [Nicotiana sylvestris]|uniref:uncharacterized protein n=1 Tax=Nicotiana sylvestris TaxID=4096 RepID=UPI00388C9084
MRRKGKGKMEEIGATQGMTRTSRVYTPEHLGGTSKEAAPKQPVIETGLNNFWRKLQAREYSIVDHLNKTPAQISILSLLQNSKMHRNALMKVLNEAYVPNNITSGEMANMVGQVLESHKITFHKDELPLEGLSHNRALHITVQFEDKFRARVLIDVGSSLNICPLTTLKRLGKDFHGIRVGSMNVKAFDGSQRATIGEINLCLQMGSTWFDVEFQEYDDCSLPWRGPYYPLEQPTPHLYQTFQHIDVKWGSEEDEALAGLRDLFLDDEYMDCNAMVKENEEEDLTIQTMEKGVVLKNWTAAPFRTYRYLLLSFIFFLYIIIINYTDEPTNVTCNETTQHKDSDSEEDINPKEIVSEVESFENKPKSNLDETEIVNLGDSETVKKTRISIYLSPSEKEEYTRFLKEYEDIFAWSYDDMAGLSTSIVAHKLPTDPMCLPVKQKLRKFKPDMSLKIKEEVTKQIKAKVLRVVEYPTWLANMVPVPKKDGKIWMDEEDAEKIVFITPWGMYNLKLNPAKCAFGAPTGKLLGFIVNHWGIELDPSKVKDIQDFPHPKSKKDVMSFLGHLNYISRFIAQSAVICEPIFKMLKKDAATKWTKECQKAFDRIKEYLSTPPVLVPPEPSRPLLLYLSVLDGAFGCVLGQHDETERKEQAIYYLSKKITLYEARYCLLECTCCALMWIAQKLRHYFYAYTTYLISRMDPLKYIFQKPIPTGKLAKWQILVSELDIVYVTQKEAKGQALVDHLAENPVGGEYEPLKTYFPNEEVSFLGEDITEAYDGWRIFFDGAANFKGVGIGAISVSEIGQHYLVSTTLRFPYTNNMSEYEACILGPNLAVDMNVQELLVIGDSDLLVHQVQGEWATKNTKILPHLHHVQEMMKRFTKIKFRHVPRIQNEFADALATLSSMIQHPDKNFIDPIPVEAASYKAVTKKVVTDFVKDRIVCRFGVPESIITDNAANLNNDLMKLCVKSSRSSIRIPQHKDLK